MHTELFQIASCRYRRAARGYARIGNGVRLILLAALVSPAHAAPTAVLQAIATETRPKIDGRLDDPAWQAVTAVTEFRQVDPANGKPASERTQLRVLYDRNHLYIAVRCELGRANAVIATGIERDGEFGDDAIRIALDPSFQAQGGYYFQLSAGGAKSDGLIEPGERLNAGWNGAWYGRTRVDAQGWSAEFAIPFATLAFDPDATRWGLNAERYIASKDETARWSGHSRHHSVHSLRHMGQLRGLQGIDQKWGLEIRPSLRLERSRSQSDVVAVPAVDLRYRLSPRLAATVTLNTDFAGTEVDDRILNLSRFPLQLPEKREFFLEDASLFDFAEGELQPFFSRRIGLDTSGRPVDIEWGAKLAGRIGNLSLGLLDMQVARHGEIEPRNLAVSRLAWELGGESRMGVILSTGDPRGDFDNEVIGVDATYRNSTLTGGKSVSATAWAAQSDSEFADARGRTFGLALRYPNEPLDLRLEASEIGQHWDPALGFTARTGVRNYEFAAYMTFRPAQRWLRHVRIGVLEEYVTTLEQRKDAEFHYLPEAFIRFSSGDELRLAHVGIYERVTEAFEIAPGIQIPAANYRDNSVQASFSTFPSRPLSAHLRLERGSSYGGTRKLNELELRYRPGPRLSLATSWRQDARRFTHGAFSADVFRLRLDAAAHRSLQWKNIVQYDNFSRTLGWYSRLRYVVEPDNDISLIVSQRFERDSNDRFLTIEQDLIVRLAWAIRL